LTLGAILKENRGASIGGLRRPSALNPENHEAYGVFLTVCLFRSCDPSVHPPHGTALAELSFDDVDQCAAAVRFFKSLDDRTALRAAISSRTSADRTAADKPGLASRQSLLRTTKYLPSGVTRCLRPAIR
jgi:hypothetical protein